ncbi:MAG: type IV secretion system DNA-binding domain-containing protein [Steroidobacteraceae bacterium]
MDHFLDVHTRGWQGFAVGYVFVGVFVVFGLIRSRATVGRYITFPIVTVPTFILAMLAATVGQWAVATFLHPSGYGLSDALTVFLLMVFGFLGGRYWAARGAAFAPRHRRGTVVHEAPRRASRLALRRFASSIALAGGVLVPPEDETKHFKLIGTTGTGKSTALRELLHGAIERGDRAVIADPDGGYLSRFYEPDRGDVILNPFDARSAKWDLFAELRTVYDVQELARALIPMSGGDTQWPAFARTFFEAITSQAQQSGVTDIGELYRLLAYAPQTEVRALTAGTPAAPFSEEGNVKMFLGMRSTASEHVKGFDFIRRQKGPSFSVKAWIREGRGVLFLPYQAEQIAAIRSVISTWMRLAIFQTMGLGEGDHRLWFAVDELDALGAIDGLPDALARLRKFGGRCALGLQSIGQVGATYGAGPAQTIVENCGNTLILRCSASERGGTARFASQLIGEREVVRMVATSSHSSPGFFSRGSGHDTAGRSEQHAVEAAVMPAEIEQLPDREGYMKFASQPAWTRVSFPVYELPKIAEPFTPYGS